MALGIRSLGGCHWAWVGGFRVQGLRNLEFLTPKSKPPRALATLTVKDP